MDLWHLDNFHARHTDLHLRTPLSDHSYLILLSRLFHYVCQDPIHQLHGCFLPHHTVWFHHPSTPYEVRCFPLWLPSPASHYPFSQWDASHPDQLLPLMFQVQTGLPPFNRHSDVNHLLGPPDPSAILFILHGPLARYAKLRVRMRRECRERFPRHRM